MIIKGGQLNSYGWIILENNKIIKNISVIKSNEGLGRQK